MSLDTETLNQFCDTVSRYVREHLVPLEEQVAEEDNIPDDVVEEMKELGLFGMTIPEEYGGLGLDMAEEVDRLRARPHLAGLPLAVRHQQRHRVAGPHHGRHPEQKAKYLPRLATGELIASFALTEPDAGSDARLGAHDRAPRRRRLRPERHQALHHERAAGRSLHRLWRAPTRTPRTPRASAPSSSRPRTPGMKLGKKDKKMGQRGALHLRRDLRGLPRPRRRA